jgi:hypothetical protein
LAILAAAVPLPKAQRHQPNKPPKMHNFRQNRTVKVKKMKYFANFPPIFELVLDE